MARHQLQKIRIAKGLSQKELAQLIDANQQDISRLETGKISMSERWLEKLTPALGVTIADIFGVRPEMSLEETQLLENFAAMSDEQRQALLNMSKALVAPKRV